MAIARFDNVNVKKKKTARFDDVQQKSDGRYSAKAAGNAAAPQTSQQSSSALPTLSAEEARSRARALFAPSAAAKAGMEFATKEEKETQYMPSLVMPQSREDQLWLANRETPLSPDYDPTEAKSAMLKIAQQYARGNYSSPAVDTYEQIAENALGNIAEKVKHPEIAAYEQERKTRSTADKLAQGQYTRDILAGDAQSDDAYTSRTTADVLADTAAAKSAVKPKEQTKAQSDREAYYTAGMETFESIPLEKRDILYDYFWIKQVADGLPDTKDEIRYTRPDGKDVVISRENYEALRRNYESLITELGKTYSADDLERMQNTLAAYANELNRAQSDVLTAKFATMQPVAASLGSIGGRMVGGITATADLIGQNLAKIGKEDGYKKPVDYNTWASGVLNAANVGRGTVSENISYTAGDFASFIYDATMSIADTTVTGALPGGKVLSSVSLVASTAFDSAKAAADRGAADWQALGVGLVSGALELAVEKIPKFGTLSRLEDLKEIPIASLGDLIRSTFASAHLEGCDEALTEILNRINECIWSPSTSSLAVAISEYEAQNNSFTDALMLAVRDMSLDVLKAYGGGFIGGAEMQGSLGTMNYALNIGTAKEYRDLFVGSDGKLNEATYNALMTKALSSKDEAVQKYAAVLADRRDSVTANDAGMLYAMVEASEEQVDFAAEIDSPARTVEETRSTFSKDGQTAFDIAMESAADKDTAARQFRIKYLEGEMGHAFAVDEDSELTPSMQEAAYKYGAEAKASLGTVTYNTRAKVSGSLAKSFEKAAKDLNVHITYGGKAPVVNGVQDRAYITSAGELRIYEDVEVRLADGRVLKGDDAATMVILGHEMTHRLQALDEKSYNAFREFVLARKSGAIEGYIKMGLSHDAAADEIVADYAMTTLFADQKTINEVTKKHSKLAEKVRDILEWIKTKLGIQSSELDRAIRLWNNAYNASARNAKSSAKTKNTADSGVKWSSGATSTGVIDLSKDNKLSAMVDGIYGSKRYSIIKNYILDELKDQPITLSDGKKAVVDNRDAQHIAAHKSSSKEAAEISRIKEIVERAKLVAEENSTKDRKFDYFWYYEASVKFGKETFPIYVNVGRAKNDSSYHIYDLTKKIRDTAHRVYGVERPVGNALLNDISIDMVPQDSDGVKSDLSQESTNGTKKSVAGTEDILYSKDDAALETAINESMTMAQAKQMIQRAFVAGGIKEWYDGEYKNGDEWLRGEGAREVALYIENEYTIQSAYLDKIQGFIDGDFYAEDIVNAYLAGTLTGKVVQKNTAKIDLANSVAVADKRFYAPKHIEDAKALLGVANARMTKANQDEVSRARAKVLLYAHNKGAAETLGLTEAELNKKLRSWSNYSTKARDIAMRINSGVQASNRWTGIENMSYVARAQISSEDVTRMVKSVEGNSDGYQNNYIGRTMMALDTHIDWSWLTFKFDTYQGVNGGYNNAGVTKRSTCNGYYRDDAKLIHVKRDAPNTVAHEMGHALDYQWARELGLHGALTEAYRNTERVTGDARIWFDHFMEFKDTLVDSSDIRSAYAGDVKETFARFIDKFVAWTEQISTGRNATFGTTYYDDKFTANQFIQFARLLQEKAALDANGQTSNKSYEKNDAGVRYSTTGTEELLFESEAEKAQYVADSFDLSGAENFKAAGSMERMSSIANSIAKAHRVNKDGRVKLAKALEKGVQNMRKAAKSDDVKVKQTAAEGFLEAAMVISPDADVQAQVEIANALAESVWAEMTTDRLPDTIRSIRDDAIKAARAEVRADRLAALGEKYGIIKPGERPSRVVTLPKKTSEGKKVSQTVRTVMEAEATPDEMIPTIEQMVADGEFSYETITDKGAVAKAEDRITKNGFDATVREWFKAVGSGKVSKDNTALGWTIYNNAANSGDTELAVEVLCEMVKHQRNAAQALQATRILKKLSPSGQLYAAQKSVQGLQEELEERYGDKAPELKIDPKLAEEVLNADTEEKCEKALADLYKDIGRQIPSSVMDKWNAWRYLSMLGNARTHIRNIVGNAGFAPVVTAKNVVATGIESLVGFVSRGKVGRTKAFLTPTKSDRALLAAAWSDYDAVADAALGQSKYNDNQYANKYIEEGKRVFKFKPLEAARRGNSWLLDKEDSWFSKPQYANALAQYCKANGITSEQIQSGKDLDKARAYAIKEAQKATYRDTNAFSELFSKLGRIDERGEFKTAKRIWNRGVEGVLPFRKTPANILARGIEYSPLGLVSVIRDLSRIKSGETTAAEAIDKAAATLTGTGLMALGAFLVTQGVLRGFGGDDDKEKEFEELMGHQQYALEIGGTSVTLDWLAPEALPFFVGANIAEQCMQDGEMTLEGFISALGSISDPMLSMSCLQGLNDLIESVSFSDTSGIVTIAASAATSYLTQGIPTLFGQIERTSESERMMTYTSKGNKMLTPDMQYTVGKVSAKLPGDYSQIPYIDAWGRTESSGSVGERVFNNFANPAYTSNISESDMEKELLRLYKQTGESVLPSRADKSFQIDGEEVYLTAEQYQKYATSKGKRSHRILTALTHSDTYNSLDDFTKAEIVSKVYSYCNAIAKSGCGAKNNAGKGYALDGWVSKAYDACSKYGIDEATYIAAYIMAGNAGKYVNGGETIDNSHGLCIMQAVYSIPGLSQEQYDAMFVNFGVGSKVRGYDKKTVESKIAKFNKKYERIEG